MWIDGYRVTAGEGYRWVLWCDGVKYVSVSDRRMGSVMAAQRELVKRIAEDHGITVTSDPASVASQKIVLQKIEIERSITQPGYRVYIESGKYSFTAYLDPTIESFLAVWSACMKFFAAKYGVVYLYDEVARNVDAAREQGMA